MRLELMELERRLIGFDTVSRNSNLALVDFLAEYLEGIGFRVQHFTNEESTKANLFATRGPSDVGGLMLAGHTDVVPVEGQAWDSDPFSLHTSEDKLYGRGTADMKSFIAQVVHAAEQTPPASLKLPLHLAFTYDEEVGCGGAARMMRQMAEQRQVLPAAAVIGEPTNFQVFRFHKGFTAAKVTVTGVEGHSSKPELGVNATHAAAQVIYKLMEVEADRKQHRSMEADFEYPYTTINVGLVRGGTAVNIIPNHCEVMFEYRTMPSEDPLYVYKQVEGYIGEILRPALKARHALAEISLEQVTCGPPMDLPQGSEIEQLALELTGNTRATAAPYYTEGAIYNEAGIPTIICGPGDIDQAHRPNEYITQEQMARGVPFVRALIARMCDA